MTRRDASWMILRAASLAGAPELFHSWLKAAHSHSANSTAPPDPHDWNSYQPKFFSPVDFQILDSFTAILIPMDDTPGAREAHVAVFIDFVVNAAAEYAPEMQTEWRNALLWLRARHFAQLTPAEQLHLVTVISDPDHEGFPVYHLLKEMTVHAFYTSRVGLVDVLEYKGLAYLKEFPACTHPEHHTA